MFPHRETCAGSGLVYVTLRLALSVLRQEGNNAQKVFNKCYQLLMGWMSPTCREQDAELWSPPPPGCTWHLPSRGWYCWLKALGGVRVTCLAPYSS